MKQPSPARIAAFFDVDGTLLPAPSLERRFFSALRYRRKFRLENYLAWLAEALRLARKGIPLIGQSNKMYLRGVCVTEIEKGSVILDFFPEAIQRVAWHASQGHAIVFVSGTLEPLAEQAARTMERRLALRGITAEIHAIATRLEEAAGSWTGRIAGIVMLAEEKALAVRKLAANWGIDLAVSYAYGDTANDRWMLAAVGRPAAVNASNELARVARLYGWPEMSWRKAGEEGRGPGLHLAQKESSIAGVRAARDTRAAEEEIKRLNARSIG